MRMAVLHNKKSKKELIKILNNENFERITLSFYRYVKIKNLSNLRDTIYKDFESLKILGRIYLAKEGINAQISLPENNLLKFQKYLNSHYELKDMELKFAMDKQISFLKLIVRLKKEIVAYKISENDYDMSVTGEHLNAKKFNDMMELDNTVVVDMRNHYESEVGRFENAICPDVDASENLLSSTKKLLKKHKRDNVLLYCTGGIRCEKASSYLIKNNFKNVYQLKGGIIQYAHQVKKSKLKSKFKGKNFVFDNRLGERITKEIISTCHQCKNLCDDHTNCANDACHLLFIQCKKCQKKYNGCCSSDCSNIQKLPIEKQKVLRKDNPDLAAPLLNKNRDRLRPKLKDLIKKNN